LEEDKSPKAFYLSLSRAKEIKEKIKELYKKEGFPNPKIEFFLISKRDKTYTLLIKIKEGKKFWIKNIFIKGNKALSERDIKKVLVSKDQAILLFRFHPPLIRENLKKDIQNIVKLYKSKGYLEVKVKDKPILNCSKDGACNITYVIEKEGPQYKFGKIEIIGAKYFIPKEILKKVKALREGKPFNAEALEEIKYHITKFYYEKGFYNAKVIIKTDVDKKKKLVNVKIICNPGKRYFINRIKIKGNYETRDWTLRRELDLKEKDIFVPESLSRSIRRLYALGFIARVNPDIKPVDNSTLNITLKVKERAFGNLRIGAAWNSLNGIFARASVSRANLKGTGDTVNFSVEVGKNILCFDVKYKHYYLFDKPINAIFNVYHTKDVYTDYTSIKTGGSVSFEERYKKDFYFTQKFTLTRNKIKDSTDPDIENSTNTYFIFTPGGKYNTLDNPFLPHRGSFIKSYLNIGYDFSNSTSPWFSSFNFEFIKYFNLNDYTYNLDLPITFLEKFLAGICTSNTPVDYKYHLGGDYTIRGYDYEEIGIYNKMWVNTFEVGYDFAKSFRAALFLDLGGYNLKTIYGGYGFGFRMLSPLGPIRFDFAWKLKPIEGKSNFNFHFGVSSYF